MSAHLIPNRSPILTRSLAVAMLTAICTGVHAWGADSAPQSTPIDQLPQTIRTQLVQVTGGSVISDVTVDARNGDPQYVARYKDTVSGEMRTVRLSQIGTVIDSGLVTEDSQRTNSSPAQGNIPARPSSRPNEGPVIVPPQRPDEPTTVSPPAAAGNAANDGRTGGTIVAPENGTTGAPTVATEKPPQRPLPPVVGTPVAPTSGDIGIGPAPQKMIQPNPAKPAAPSGTATGVTPTPQPRPAPHAAQGQSGSSRTEVSPARDGAAVEKKSP